MSDKFLNTGGSGGNISNGTANVYAAILGAVNLNASMPIKTNSTKQLVSEKLDITDIQNLESRLDNALTNPYVGTFEATDFETANHFSVNAELDKITNISSAVELPTPITTLTGELDVAKIKSYEHNAEIEFDNNNLTMFADGDIQLNSDSITLTGPTLTYNGNGVVSELGGNNLDTTLTTTQTSFTADQQLITKKFVDDAIAPVNNSISQLEQKDNTHNQQIADLNDKTQHITADATETKIEEKTTMRESVIGYNDISENVYLSSVGDDIGLYKSPTQEGYVNYTNDILTLGGTPMSRIYGPSDGYYIGEKLAISNDGNIVATIAQIADNTAENETWNGACHIYQIVNGVYTQLGQVLYGDDSNDQLQRVSLSSDGLTVAVGSFQNNNNTGNVRVYRYNQNTSLWVLLGDEIVGESAGDQFGSSISLSSDGNIIIIGANKADPNGISSGHARVFQYSTGWVQLGGTIEGPSADDNAGECVSINGAGNRIIVGMPFIDINGTNNVGTGKIYDLVNGQWVFNTQIDGTVFDTRLGLTVQMSEDGNTIAISTEEANNQAGYAEVYRNTNGVNWVQLGQRIVGEYSGDLMTKQNSMSLSKDGNTIALAAYLNDNAGTNAGHVRVYRYNQNTSLWVQLGGEFNGDSVGDQFGRSVALNENGNILVVGSPFADEITSSDNRGYFIAYQYVIDEWVNMGKFGVLTYSNFKDLYSGIINIALDINLDWTASGGEFVVTFGIYKVEYKHFGGIAGGSFTFYANNVMIHSEATGIPNTGASDIVKVEIIFDVSQKVFTVQSRGVILLTLIDNSTDIATDEQIKTLSILGGSRNGSDSILIYDIDVKNNNFVGKVGIDVNSMNLNGVQPITFKDTGSQIQKGMIVSGDDDKLYVYGTRGINLYPQAGVVNIIGGLKLGNWILSMDIGNDNLTATHSTGTEVILAQP
jgi:hypothetical protein